MRKCLYIIAALMALICIGANAEGRLSIVCTVVPYLLYQVGLGCGIDGGNASIAATAEIVAATTYNVVAFGDVVEPLQVLGMAIVFAGVALPIVLSRVAHARDEVPEPVAERVTARQ